MLVQSDTALVIFRKTTPRAKNFINCILLVENTFSPLFPAVKDVYLFKVFKKTTRFKKYRKYQTGFVMNRRRYMIRKKRTRFQYLFNSAAAWGGVYRRVRQVTRFLQNVNILNVMLTFSCANFLRKTCISTFYKKRSSPIPNFSSVAKTIFFNTSMFLHPNETFLRSISTSSHLGVVAADKHELLFLDTTQSGSFIHHFWFLTLPTEVPMVVNNYYTSNFIPLVLRQVSLFTKHIRQILVWLTLQSLYS